MVQAPPKPEQTSVPSGVESTTDPIVLHLPEGVMTDDLLIEISNLNEPWHFERSMKGALEISPPPGSLSGKRSGRIFAQILHWSDELENGECFPRVRFLTFDRSARDPDASWISSERLSGLSQDDEGLWSVCPDLIVEVRSRGQRVRQQQTKMEEWRAAGARLGWLIDPYTGDGVAWIYREGDPEPERMERPDTLSGEDVAEGLTVDLAKVWR